MDPQGLPGTVAGLEPKSTGASLVLEQAGHLGPTSMVLRLQARPGARVHWDKPGPESVRKV